ncbi:phage tail tape measure protein [Pseudomonas citronellolis]|uniref:phage tail tape measure protein n=1 Tax=Pseudomonas citronellolis TaxID=53408 RepID=UPI002D78D2C3|nr:phage tail tape measure protein [Pseudomonas citronellolis]WRT82728.1 phage tail tape measure protein [Pseudomonas citronellolis]
MSKNLAIGLVLGGAVSATVGKAFGNVSSRIDALQKKGQQARALQGLIGETQRLQREYLQLHRVGDAAADGVLRKLNGNLDALRKQGVEVRNLDAAYRRMGATTRSLELRASGMSRINAGVALGKSAAGDAAKLGAAMVVPAAVSANYNAIVRDIAIKAGVAGAPEERDMSRKIISTSRDTGLGRNDVAGLINQLVGAGMDLGAAVNYAPVASKFVVGQGAGADDTGRMINALQQNARISDPAEMQRALEAIAYQGQAGSFEASDMAKWFPSLLAEMAKQGVYGLDAVTQLGAMLQVQMKTAGSSDEAANNLKNWFGKISAGDTVKAYAKAGIDYQGSMNKAIANGLSPVEASFELARKYIEAVDPTKAKEMAKGLQSISKESDPQKVKTMTQALEESLKTGDLFSDMQVKAALTAYMQNRDLYQSLKTESRNATGILEKNLQERREASRQRWAEVGHAWDDALRSIGDAIAPFTDWVADMAKSIGQGVANLSDSTKGVVVGLVSVAGGLVAIKSAVSAFRIGRGVLDLARSGLPGRGPRGTGRGGLGGGLGDLLGGGVGAAGVQRVFVTNWPLGGGGLDAGPAGGGRRGAGRIGRFAGMAGAVKGALPMAVLASGLQAYDTYQNAETRDEKAEGYGSAAGTLAGTLAGAAAGAALGSVIPIIGTAAGGLIGGILGGLGGSSLGGTVGRALFGDDKSEGPAADAASKPPAPAEPEQKPAAVSQSMTFAPQLSITVQGDVKDPRRLADDLFPHLQRLFDDYRASQQRSGLFDIPNV